MCRAILLSSNHLSHFTFSAIIAGGGAPEIECAIQLADYAKTLSGSEAYCVRAFAEALEVIPFTLAENAGLNPISTVTTLRAEHKAGNITTGINVRKVCALGPDPFFLACGHLFSGRNH